MATYIPLELTQPQNKMTQIAEQKRKELVTKNDYAISDNEYSQTNPDAISDGDNMGRGTGTYLDTLNGGTLLDTIIRTEDFAMNKFNPKNPYNTNPQ
jgi:hypothetical protein